MFVFDDLLEIDDRGMQELLRQVPADKLLHRAQGRGRDLQGQGLQEHVAARGRDAEGRPAKPRARCAWRTSKRRRRKSCWRRASWPTRAPSSSAARASRICLSPTAAAEDVSRWDLPTVEGAPLPRPAAEGVNVMHLAAVEREAWEHGYKDGHVEGVRKGEAELAKSHRRSGREDRGARGHHRNAGQAARGAGRAASRPSSRGSR